MGLIINSLRRVWPTMGRTSPRLIVLGYIRKLAKCEPESEPWVWASLLATSSIVPDVLLWLRAPWLVIMLCRTSRYAIRFLPWVPALPSLNGRLGPGGWNKLFLLQAAFGQCVLSQPQRGNLKGHPAQLESTCWQGTHCSPGKTLPKRQLFLIGSWRHCFLCVLL